MLEARCYIDGRWETGEGAPRPNVDPATGEVIGEVRSASPAQLERAVAAAAKARVAWRRFPAPRRAEILFEAAREMTRLKEELSRELVLEMGKVLDEARGDVQESIDLAYYFGGEGRRLIGMTSPSESRHKLAYAMRVPVGVVAAISPFNFPFAIPALKSLPAIIGGNTVVLKPASDTPQLAVRFVEVMEAAGLPAGVLNLVHGGGETIGAALATHASVDLVSFTGSRGVGATLRREMAETSKRTLFELGGKNCIIVADDADLDLATRIVTWSAFGTTGQRCTSASRIVVMDEVYDEFVERIVASTKGLRLGSGLDASIDVGPLVNETARTRVAGAVRGAIAEGASVAVGGEAPDGPGWFYRPTVLLGAGPGTAAWRDEIFGPVTAIVRAKDLPAAIRLANDTEYGLSTAIVTESIASALLASEEVQTGLFYVNAGTIGAEAHLPSGGMKASGDGRREASEAALDAYTEWRAVYVDYSGRIQRAQIDLETFDPNDA